MQRQHASNWCWSATSVSVAHYFGATTWTQCLLATRELQQRGKIATTVDCCQGVWLCDIKHSTALGLIQVGCFKSGHSALDRPHVMSELSAGNPICVRVEWHLDDAHAVAIVGYDQDNDILIIGDPGSEGASTLELVFFDEFTYTYHQQGRWVASILTVPPNGNVRPGPRQAANGIFALVPEFLRQSRRSATVEKMEGEGTVDVYRVSVTDLAEGRGFNPAHIGRETFLQPNLARFEADDGSVALRHGEGVTFRLNALINLARTHHDNRLHIVEIPALGMTAVWFEERNWIIPIGNVPRAVVPGEIYPPRMFAAKLQDDALQYIQFRADELDIERELGFDQGPSHEPPDLGPRL